MTLLVGDPGLGKSTIALDIVARVTTGTPWPDGTPGVPAALVVLLSAEDGAADTIRPRLDAAGAAVEKVELLTGVRDGDRERGFHLADVAVLDAALVQTGARLVVGIRSLPIWRTPTPTATATCAACSLRWPRWPSATVSPCSP